MNEIDSLIASLEQEIRLEQQGTEQYESLERLQQIAATYEGEDRIISSLELWEDIKNAPPERKILTGFEEFDRILEGFRETQLIILSGITKHGKTSMAIELTIRLKEEHPLWFSFEEPAVDLVRKFVERNEEPPLFFTPKKMLGNSLEWVEKKIVESIAKHNSRVIFIDHLGFLQDSVNARNDENMAYKIERIVRSLKQMAVRWKIVTVLLCHLTKTKIDTNPSFDDLKGSSAIAQEADTVMILWRNTKREGGKIVITNETNLSIQANRRVGRTGNIRFIYQNGRFKEDEWQQGETVVENW
ncbi:MAG: AAA family ATPase [Patescibacteria group bacterium]|nr:AAA family ATPase [Patescibacteria group bacterium]